MMASIYPASYLTEDQLVQNVRALIDAVMKAKPSGAKGTFVKGIALTTTMGPGLKIEPQSVIGG